jgi:hypothetical protein
MKVSEIKVNICDIATGVFKDTQILFEYAVDPVHPFSDLDIGIF